MMNPLGVVQEFYRAMAAGQIEKVVALLSPDLQWEEAERFPYYGGVWKNPQAVVDNLFTALATDWEEFSATPHNFVCSNENVVSFGLYTGKFRATGRSISAPFAHRWLVRGERIAQFKQYTDTAMVLEATIGCAGQTVSERTHGSACDSTTVQEFKDFPIACRLTTEELRAREATLLAQFRSLVVSTEDLANGYAFRVPGDAKSVVVAAELIAAERECCPFLAFEFTADPKMGPMVVRVTGPSGTKEFLRGVFVQA